jgi:hypothetical protein
MSYLGKLDQIAAELRQRHPGWQIWFVPELGRAPAWCARPWPLLNAASPEHLEAEIAQAHAEASENWPALAPEPPATAADGPAVS